MPSAIVRRAARRLGLPASLAPALAVVLLSAPGLAAATAAPPAPLLQGPSSVSTSQPFQVSFYYPKGQVKRYQMEFYRCQAGSNVRPSDSKADPVSAGGCKLFPTLGNLISPDTGRYTVDVKHGMTSVYQYQHQGATNAQFMSWYEGSWYLRARLISLSGAFGPWGKWHRTFVGSPYIGKPIGIGSAIANNRGLAPAVIMRGLQPPRIAAPMEGRIFYGGPPNIAAAVTLPAHGQYAKWACCELQWQRAVIVTAQNSAYAKTHASGGTERSAFASARRAWNTKLGLAGYSPVTESGPAAHGGWSYNLLSPHSHKFGYRYWFRVREQYLPGNNKLLHGPWSAWRSFAVQERFASTTVNLRGVQAVPGAHPGSPSSSGSNSRNARRAPSAPMHRLSLPAQRTLNR